MVANERTPLIRNQASAEAGSDSCDAEVIGPRDLSSSEKWHLLAAIWLGSFLLGLDGTVVAATSTHIGNSFNQLNRAAWINTAFMLTSCASVPIYGKVSDIAGRRWALNIAWTLFTLGCLLCGLSSSMEMLIVARLIQGAGAGGVGVVGTCVLSDVCSLKERALLSGIGATVWSVGTGLGAPFGGVFSDSIGWRWAFLVQVPCMLMAQYRASTKLTYRLPDQSDSIRLVAKRVDWAGSATLISSLSLLVLALGFKTNEGMPWGDPAVIGAFSGSLVASIIFVAAECMSSEPILDMKLLWHRTRFACVAISTFGSAAIVALWLYFPMLLQIVRDTSASDSGLHLIPTIAFGCVGSLVLGFVIRRSGEYRVNGILVAACIAPALFAVSTIGQSTAEWVTWIYTPPAVLGSNAIITVSTVAMLAELDITSYGAGLGALALFRGLGQVLGLAGASAVQQTVLARGLEHVLDDRDLIDALRKSADTIALLPHHLRVAVKDAFRASFQAVFLVGATLGLVTFIAACFVEETSLGHTPNGGSQCAVEERDTHKSVDRAEV